MPAVNAQSNWRICRGTGAPVFAWFNRNFLELFFYVAKEILLPRIIIDGRKAAVERENSGHLTPPRSADKRGSLNAAARGVDVRPRLFFG